MLPVTLYTVLVAALAYQVGAQSSSSSALPMATTASSNPIGATYTAILPIQSGKPQGSISAASTPNGVGVSFRFSISALPAQGGPFLYHIHAAPVPSDGNCTGTLAHLDPTNRGETPPCDYSLPASCQVGDLSGKYGTINSDPYSTAYVDYFASTNPASSAYFGNLSLTVHFANKTRLTCANFTMVSAGSTSCNSTTVPYTPTQTPLQVTNSASSVLVPTLSLFVAVFAWLL